MTAPPLPGFDEPDLAAAVAALPPGALDRLPFGVILVDAAGLVRVYSEAERRLSGSGGRPRVGLDFFAAVAPCMDSPEFRGRIEAARASGRFDLEFGWVGDFADARRALRVRVQPADGGGIWIFMLREG
jgi:photoactive yellow protein